MTMVTGGNVKNAKTGFYYGWMVNNHPHILRWVGIVQLNNAAKQRGVATLASRTRAFIAYRLLSFSYNFVGDVIAECAAAESRYTAQSNPRVGAYYGIG